jgi:hypothetical protein
MKENQRVSEELLVVVKRQIKDNNPPETKQAYDRLIRLGYSESDTMKLLGQCLAVEIYDVLKEGKPYNDERYKKHLNELPEAPFN